MLKGFTSFLDNHLGESRLAKASLVILAFGGMLGFLFDSSAFRVTAVLVGALCTLRPLIMLISGPTGPHHRIDNYQGLLTHYCDLIYGQSDHLWRIDRWEESIKISKNGDVIGSILVHALTESDELHFCRLRIGANWPQPERYRRRVRVIASSIEVDGAGGTRWDQTLNWLSDGRLEVLAHFKSAPPKKGEELTLRFEFEWPGKAAPLMRFREPDEFVITMGRPLAYFSYQVELPPGTQVRYDSVGLKRGIDSFGLSRTSTEPPVICLVAHDIEADRRIGMRLDLK